MAKKKPGGGSKPTKAAKPVPLLKQPAVGNKAPGSLRAKGKDNITLDPRLTALLAAKKKADAEKKAAAVAKMYKMRARKAALTKRANKKAAQANQPPAAVVERKKRPLAGAALAAKQAKEARIAAQNQQLATDADIDAMAAQVLEQLGIGGTKLGTEESQEAHRLYMMDLRDRKRMINAKIKIRMRARMEALKAAEAQSKRDQVANNRAMRGDAFSVGEYETEVTDVPHALEGFNPDFANMIQNLIDDTADSENEDYQAQKRQGGPWKRNRWNERGYRRPWDDPDEISTMEEFGVPRDPDDPIQPRDYKPTTNPTEVLRNVEKEQEKANTWLERIWETMRKRYRDERGDSDSDQQDQDNEEATEESVVVEPKKNTELFDGLGKVVDNTGEIVEVLDGEAKKRKAQELKDTLHGYRESDKDDRNYGLAEGARKVKQILSESNPLFGEVGNLLQSVVKWGTVLASLWGAREIIKNAPQLLNDIQYGLLKAKSLFQLITGDVEGHAETEQALQTLRENGALGDGSASAWKSAGVGAAALLGAGALLKAPGAIARAGWGALTGRGAAGAAGAAGRAGLTAGGLRAAGGAAVKRFLPLGAIVGAVKGFGTSTDEYAKRINGVGYDGGFWSGLGYRTAGVLGDVGDALTFGQASKFGNWASGGEWTDPYAEKGPTTIPEGSGTPNEKARQAFDFFVSRGWSPAQASGLVANLQMESSMNERISGDGGKAYGLAQWHADRQAVFEKAFGKPIRSSTFAEQLAFVDYELRNNEKSAGQRLAQARSAAEAGDIVSRYYERPAAVEWDAARRSNAAKHYHAQVTASGTAAQPTAQVTRQTTADTPQSNTPLNLPKPIQEEAPKPVNQQASAMPMVGGRSDMPGLHTQSIDDMLLIAHQGGAIT